MSYDDILGILAGLALLAVAVGYAIDAYRHPGRFDWLRLPQSPHESPVVFSSHVNRQTD